MICCKGVVICQNPDLKAQVCKVQLEGLQADAAVGMRQYVLIKISVTWDVSHLRFHVEHCTVKVQ